MKQMGGLKIYGSLMMRHDHIILNNWLINSDWEYVDYVAPALLPDSFYEIGKMGIDYKCYDIDPKFKNNPDYHVCDVIFDPVRLRDRIINFNAHKMYPIGKVHKGEFMIAGTTFGHNGDCNNISSIDQLVNQNELHTVYKSSHIPTNHIEYFMVWGRND
jgi:hypothetical protein